MNLPRTMTTWRDTANRYFVVIDYVHFDSYKKWHDNPLAVVLYQVGSYRGLKQLVITDFIYHIENKTLIPYGKTTE